MTTPSLRDAIFFELFFIDSGWVDLEAHFETAPELRDLLIWICAKTCPKSVTIMVEQALEHTQTGENLSVQIVQADTRLIQDATDYAYTGVEHVIPRLKELIFEIPNAKDQPMFHIESHWKIEPSAHVKMQCAKLPKPEGLNV